MGECCLLPLMEVASFQDLILLIDKVAEIHGSFSLEEATKFFKGLNGPDLNPDSLISENKFAPLKVEDSQHIPDFSPNVHRLFHNDSSTDRIREEGLQLMALEENIILPLPNEETIEIESVTKLEPVASMQKKEGKPQRKGEASLNSNKKLTREVKALLALQAYSSSGGIFILWKEESITVVDSIQDQFSISIRCKFNTSFSGWITGVYDPSSYRLTDQFWWELSGLYGMCNEN
ncbi:hypothetical protein E5676_scaffold104G00740 [Cucumis melo var. makuwa]|uniref:Uncharacterized protein n=1 Tax=Cucumis melo var. makuwa TaxID=1194695 RepID=A0A5D3B943_CUCMM|nr:hypothetical protein E5676_scaffold104G00740 [Cucumis melo var. makuwa]